MQREEGNFAISGAHKDREVRFCFGEKYEKAYAFRIPCGAALAENYDSVNAGATG